MVSTIPVPDFIPAIQYQVNDYLVFDLNWAAILTGFYVAYYFALEPFAAVSTLSSRLVKTIK